MTYSQLSDRELFNTAIETFVQTRKLFQEGKSRGLFLGNDNLVGDIGEYYVMEHYRKQGLEPKLAPKKNSPYDIEIPSQGLFISVKTITDWSEHKMGTQVKPLDRENNPWNELAVVQLDDSLKVKMLSIISLYDLLKQPVFIDNEKRRTNDGTITYPRVTDWEWLSDYSVINL